MNDGTRKTLVTEGTVSTGIIETVSTGIIETFY